MHIGGENETGIQKDQDLQAMMSQAKTADDSMIIQKVYGVPAKNLMQPGKDSSHNSTGVNSQWVETDYHSAAAYDSAQKALAPEKRDGWLKRRINIKKIELSLRYEKEHGELFRELVSKFYA